MENASGTSMERNSKTALVIDDDVAAALKIDGFHVLNKDSKMRLSFPLTCIGHLSYDLLETQRIRFSLASPIMDVCRKDVRSEYEEE